jgi:hypothetical protein
MTPLAIQAELVRTGDYKRFPGFAASISSQVRAAIAAMDHDAVNAGLWALAAFDPALVHLAELREHFKRLPEEDLLRVTLDRLASVYVEGQCHELLVASGITTQEARALLLDRLGMGDDTMGHILDCTDHPLGVELFSYAQFLGVLTAHDTAPWKRFAAVMADCHAHLEAKV